MSVMRKNKHHDDGQKIMIDVDGIEATMRMRVKDIFKIIEIKT